MRRRRRVIQATLLVLFVALVAGAALEPYHVVPGLIRGESFHQLRPTSYWRKVLREDGRAGQLSARTKEVFNWNGGAILLECLKDPDPHVRRPAALLLGRVVTPREALQELRPALADPDRNVRILVLRALAWKGFDAMAAGADIAAMLQDPDEELAHEADAALWEINPRLAVSTCGWKPFESKEWQFSAVFPKGLDEKTQEIPTPFGPASVRMWAAAHRATFLTVAVTEYPPEVADAFTDEDWFNHTNVNAPAFGLAVLRDEPIERDGFKGRKKLAEHQESEGQVLSQIFRIGHRQVHAQAAFNPKYVTSGAVRYFLDSFHITAVAPPNK